MTTLNKTASEVITTFCANPTEATTSHVRKATTGLVGTAALGRTAERSSANLPIHSLTDVTGFGLIGHAREMALASNASLLFHLNQIPILEGALDCIRAGNIPGGLNNNRDFAECVVGYEEGIPDELKTILFDPQTAGGLLIAVAAEHSRNLIGDLRAAGVPVVEIGEVQERAKPLITVAV
jgi:selenide,water dikinase